MNLSVTAASSFSPAPFELRDKPLVRVTDAAGAATDLFATRPGGDTPEKSGVTFIKLDNISQVAVKAADLLQGAHQYAGVVQVADGTLFITPLGTLAPGSVVGSGGIFNDTAPKVAFDGAVTSATKIVSQFVGMVRPDGTYTPTN